MGHLNTREPSRFFAAADGVNAETEHRAGKQEPSGHCYHNEDHEEHRYDVEEMPLSEEIELIDYVWVTALTSVNRDRLTISHQQRATAHDTEHAERGDKRRKLAIGGQQPIDHSNCPANQETDQQCR